MYIEKPMAFYRTLPNMSFYDGELSMELDMQKMKSFYPQTSSKIQSCVEDCCDRMEYEGSFLYDESPDRLMLNRTCEYIYEQVIREEAAEMESQELSGFALRELVQVLFFNEMHHRRCRRHRCRRFL